ncbi:DSF synthase [Mariprofundus aestuarium]|uniref:DSF synthase n=1 Tax=Mariprofundus aestuarium TaxID=1921086 RepID=A0A2K8KUW8_MARES|nr:crotonase/enoyl-CoA hydratase family protein [Mariprofundus aestuarium]ATX78537.1 DSF synthase [Mariprofundus aestuarium]
MGQNKYKTNSLFTNNFRGSDASMGVDEDDHGLALKVRSEECEGGILRNTSNEGIQKMEQHRFKASTIHTSEYRDAYKYVEQYKLKNNTLRKSECRHSYTSMGVFYEDNLDLAWYCMKGLPRPCFTPKLLDETLSWLRDLRNNSDLNHIKYLVVTSDTPEVFNLGGDLDLFCKLIRTRNRTGLLEYATACIKAVYQFHTGLDKDITTISLVQGDALGGGFETAIAGEVLIAEKGSKMGMPEILFNLFPGMGALSLLSRKVGLAQAEKMILSGKVYSAQEMFELGIVDVLVEKGEGKQAVYDYLKRESRARNGFRALRRAKRFCNPVSYEELESITSVWVDAALELTAKDLRMMERLINKQTQKAG